MHKVKIGVLVSGGGTNLQALIDAIEQNHINGEIVCVISDKKDAFALERAQRHGISGLFIDKKQCTDRTAFNFKVKEALDEAGAELVVLAGFMSILEPCFIKHYEGRVINIHPALIPSFCGNGFYGQRVHQAAIDYGVKVSGATVHFVDEGTDTGAIILQDTVSVDMDDTAETLAAKVLKVEHRLLPKAVALYCDGRLKLEGRRVRII